MDQFNTNIDIRTLNLLDAIDLAKVWISTNTTVQVRDLFIGFLKFYAIDFWVNIKELLFTFLDNIFYKFSFPNNIISIRTRRKMNKQESLNEIDILSLKVRFLIKDIKSFYDFI
jgi:hypothetical protein